MAPKGSEKQSAEKPEPEKKTPTKPATAKKPKVRLVFTTLTKDGSAPIPIDVVFEGTSIEAKLTKGGKHIHVLKLEAPSSFTLLKTVVFQQGEFAGQQAVIIRPAKAFKFLEVPKEVRARIYSFYFAPEGVVRAPIVLEGKRANKDIYAKSYADRQKNRVGLLAVNKEIHEEATPIFYAHKLKLESTTTLLSFLSQLPTTSRPLLRALELKQWIKTTSRNSMHFLAESASLTRLHIDTGVFNEGDPSKAARVFHADAYKFLEAVGNARGDKGAGVDVLSFGKNALQYKDDKKNLKPWAEAQVEEMKENLRKKLT